jgi:hypothetical protein
VVDDDVVIRGLPDRESLIGQGEDGAGALGVEEHEVEVLSGQPLPLGPGADDGVGGDGGWR